MQLFLLDHINQKGNDIIIDDPGIRQQAKKVLRIQGGDQIFVQDEHTRYEIVISELRDMKISGTIKHALQAPINEKHITMLVAMPNKREKIELIAQKLSEIGIDRIVFRPAERSVIKEWNDKKNERLKKIAKEAVEQSRGRQLPIITFSYNPEHDINDAQIIIFDKKETSISKVQDLKSKVGIVGPEGGLTTKDYQRFEASQPQIKNLGETVLRTETAAIIAGRLIKNSL